MVGDDEFIYDGGELLGSDEEGIEEGEVSLEMLEMALIMEEMLLPVGDEDFGGESSDGFSVV